ncbi:uncharacterized protein LOC132705861 isoform X2 [Cylas formicarius]|nr:uncharacterized protein LOC132705861 isoform X2 [Cylas formicarius]
MELEIDGKTRKSIRAAENPHLEARNSFQITTEQGDTVTCKHSPGFKIVPKSTKDEEVTGRVTFSNNEATDVEEKEEDSEPTVGELLKNFPKKQVDVSKTERDQISMLLKQIQKMKAGLERLRDIAMQFNCSERFNEDLSFLMTNLKPELRDGDEDSTDHNLSSGF